jgi:hypothetical protein
MAKAKINSVTGIPCPDDKALQSDGLEWVYGKATETIAFSAASAASAVNAYLLGNSLFVRSYRRRM